MQHLESGCHEFLLVCATGGVKKATNGLPSDQPSGEVLVRQMQAQS
jgi:hypothetical protein